MINHKEAGTENTVANTNDELVYMWHKIPYYHGELPQKLYEADFQQLDEASKAVQDLFRIATKGREGIIAEYQNREEYWDDRTLAFIKGKEEVLITAHHAVDENYRDEYDLSVMTRLTKEHHDEFTKEFQEFCSEHKIYRSTALLSEYDGENRFAMKHATLAVGTRKEFEYEPVSQLKDDKLVAGVNRSLDNAPTKDKNFYFKRSEKLTDKQNKFAYAIEKWAFENDKRNNKGYLLSYNRNAENVPASFNLLVKQAQAQGFNKLKANDLEK